MQRPSSTAQSNSNTEAAAVAKAPDGTPTLQLWPTSWYVKRLRKALPSAAFTPAHSRLLWLPCLALYVALAGVVVSSRWVPWPLQILLSVTIGVAFGSLSFVAHEALHGALTHVRWLQYLVGFIGFLPFVVSPRLWRAWHNRAHHDNTGRPGRDPDAYPTLAEYQSSATVRFVTDYFAMGRSRSMGILCLLIGFTGQSLQILVGARRRGILSKGDHRKAIAETALGVLFWGSLVVVGGMPTFLFVCVLPLVVGNTIIMAFILTNHSLSPVTETNDPLVNSLSVTAPRWFEWLTLNFGYHVEHHLFRSMSSRHAPLVRQLIQERWPERYQTLALGKALLQLHRSPRVYKDDHTLVDPLTGEEWPLPLPGPCSRTAVASLPS